MKYLQAQWKRAGVKFVKRNSATDEECRRRNEFIPRIENFAIHVLLVIADVRRCKNRYSN